MSQSHRVPVEAGFTDGRGTILPLTHGDANVQMIWSKAGALRANHYHKTDTHTCYLVTGEMMFYWRDHGDTTIHREHFKQGDMFKTGPMIDHEMVFETDSVMVVISEHKRDADTYDQDIVKIAPLHEQYVAV